MKTFGLIVRVVLTLATLVVSWVAYDYAAKFLEQALRLLFAAAPVGGKIQVFLSTHWVATLSWGGWAIIIVMLVMVMIVLRRIWGR